MVERTRQGILKYKKKKKKLLFSLLNAHASLNRFKLYVKPCDFMFPTVYLGAYVK